MVKINLTTRSVKKAALILTCKFTIQIRSLPLAIKYVNEKLHVGQARPTQITSAKKCDVAAYSTSSSCYLEVVQKAVKIHQHGKGTEGRSREGVGGVGVPNTNSEPTSDPCHVALMWPSPLGVVNTSPSR